ncbi:MAG: hypothetical protein HYS27_27715 [Deltaproteobacteria bacterium]|nr:hypothetical protein [Deltaproteobacteria bacterium]
MTSRRPPPAIRGAYLRDNYAVLDRLGADVAAHVNARLDGEVLRGLAAARADAWEPVELDVALTDALFAELGERGLRRANREVFLAAIEGPLLKPMFAGLRRMLGITPLALLRLAPRLWNTIYRGCGDLSLEQHEGRHAIVLDGVPPALLASPPYFLGVSGVIDACFVLTRRTGTVDVEVDAEARRVRWRVHWE